MQRLGTKSNTYIAIVISIVLTAALLIRAVPFAYAANSLLLNRYDQLSTPTASATSTHNIGFTVSDPTSIGSVVFEFCGNSPVFGVPCIAPSGFDASAAVLSSQTGETGFSISPLSSSNSIILTRPVVAPNAIPATYVFTGMINPNIAGTFYIRMSTYNSTDGTGTSIQEGGAAMAIVSGLNVSAEVPPWLKFCVSVTISGVDCSSATSYLIDIGELSTVSANKASWEFVVGTNAGYGYSVSMHGTTLTSGNNVIPSLPTQTSSQPGTSQFGVNLRANSSPLIGAEPSGPGTRGVVTPEYATANVYRFQTGDTVVTANGTDDMHKFTTSFIANVSKSQAAGVYTTTISYICLANF